MVCLFSFSSFPISIEISHSLFEKMLFFAFLFLCVCVFPDLDQFLISQHICVKKKKIKDGKEFPKSSSESVGIFFTIQCPSESNNILSSAISWSSGGD